MVYGLNITDVLPARLSVSSGKYLETVVHAVDFETKRLRMLCSGCFPVSET